MILPDYMLIQKCLDGMIDPFDVTCVNPASIDLRWSGSFKRTGFGDWLGVEHCESLLLEPGCLYLLSTLETVHMRRTAPDSSC